MAKKTGELDFELENTSNLDEFLQNNETEFDDKNFYKLLNQHIKQSGKSKFKIAADSGISESYMYNLVNGQKRPARDTIIKLSFSLNLPLESIDRLLKLAGYSGLYVKHKRDSIIKFAIENSVTLWEVDELLIKYSLVPLLE